MRESRATWMLRYLLPLLLLVSTTAAAQTDVDRLRLAQLEAAYLINFARYTDWPADAFAAPDSPLVILVHGDSTLVKAMTEIATRADPIAGHKIKLRGTRAQDYPTPEELSQLIANSHVLFIDEPFVGAVGELLVQAHAHSVLTVSNAPGFAAAGGMFELVRSGQRVSFDANPESIRTSRLSVSSRVLKLARQLTGGG